MTRSLLLSIAIALLAATPALADEAIAELGREAPVAGYGGWKAWSRFDEGSQRYTLMLRAPDDTLSAAPVPASTKPFDLSLGPGPDGDVVAIYRRCGSDGCDLRLLHVAEGSTESLPTVSSPHYSEATPAIWRSTVVFTRRIRRCDVPYVKALGSSAPSRMLLRSRCVQIPAGYTSIRGTRILTSSVDISGADVHLAGPKVSEIRAYSSRRRGSAVLLRQRFGEEPNYFGQVAQDDRFAYTVRVHGFNKANTFVRVPVGGGRPDEARAFRALNGAFAKPTPKESLYVEQQGGEESACDGLALVPCRLILSPVIPFGGAQRTITPQLSVGYAPAQPRRGQPLTFTGRLTRHVVTQSAEVRVEPLAGVDVELYHRTGSHPERFDATGLHGVTAADGSYEIVLPAAGDDPWYTAVAATPGVPTWAGRGTVGSVGP